jgi:putative ABC transport system substrate-binding protein
MNKKIIILLVAIIVIAAVSFAVLNYYVKPLQESKNTKMYRVGLLQFAPTVSENMDGFKTGMGEMGYEEGKNITYFYRDANGSVDTVKQYAKELADMNLDMIFVNTSPATGAIKEATKDSKTPVVFSMVADPLGAGFVASVESSGNNLTGTGCAYIEIAAKRLEILKEISPSVKKVLVFYRPEDKSGGPAAKKIIEKSEPIGVEIIAVPISQPQDIKNYLMGLKAGDIDAIMDPADSMVTSAFPDLLETSLKLKVPLMMLSKGEAEKGALVSFGVDYIDLGKQSSLIANQVLAGIPPQNIPFEQPRKFFMAVNMKTASQIGLEMPKSILEKTDLIIR